MMVLVPVGDTKINRYKTYHQWEQLECGRERKITAVNTKPSRLMFLPGMDDLTGVCAVSLITLEKVSYQDTHGTIMIGCRTWAVERLRALVFWSCLIGCAFKRPPE